MGVSSLQAGLCKMPGRRTLLLRRRNPSHRGNLWLRFQTAGKGAAEGQPPLQPGPPGQAASQLCDLKPTRLRLPPELKLRPGCPGHGVQKSGLGQASSMLPQDPGSPSALGQNWSTLA